MSLAPASASPVTRAAPPGSFRGGWAARDGLAGCYLACLAVGQGTYVFLSPSARASFLAFASTDVANLIHDPLGCLVVSAFVTGGNAVSTLLWLPMIAIALCGASRAIGSWRAACVAAAGHVLGTLVSEGLVAWRVSSGALPESYRYLTDVGPSYIVVSALALAMLGLPWSRSDRSAATVRARLAGTLGDRPAWTWRVLAAVDMFLLAVPGQIFSGLFSLDVAAVGHVTAIATGALAAGVFLRRRGRLQPPRGCRQATVPPTASPMR